MMAKFKTNPNLQFFVEKFKTIDLHYLLLFLILAVGITIRINHFNRAPIDAHPMRQTDVHCVIHFLRENNLNLLKPQSCLIRPPTNSEGFFFFELPLYQTIVSSFQTTISVNDWWSIRLVNIGLFSLAYILFYLGTENLFDKKTAVIQSLIFAFIPSGIFFFGQAIHPDVLMIAALAAAWYFLSLFLTKNSQKYLVFLITALNITIATRPFMALCLPPFAYLIWKKSSAKQALTLFSSGILYGLWFLWQQQFPQADHTWQQWIFSGRRSLLDPVMLKNLIYKNLFGEVLGKVTALLSLLGIGRLLIKKRSKIDNFVLIWVGMIPLYWLIVPAGNIFHQYYAHVIIFPLILAAAQALIYIESIATKLTNPVFGKLGLLAASGLIIFNGYHTSRYFWVRRVTSEEVRLSEEIKKVVPAHQKIIYLGQSSPTLSLSLRQGLITGQPPADLKKKAQAVKSQLGQVKYIVKPHFDDSFPDKEWTKLTNSVELTEITSSQIGAIYQLKQ
jgi:hypothetical protein